MSSLPQIGSGQLMVNGDVQRNAEIRSTLDFNITNGTASKRNPVYPRQPSILTVSESLPSIHDSRESHRRKSRSRSLDPSATEGTLIKAKKRRENDSRSKSLDPRTKDEPRSVKTPLTESDELQDEIIINGNETDSEKARRVRFSNDSVASPVSHANNLDKQVDGRFQGIAEKQIDDVFHATGNSNRTRIQNDVNIRNIKGIVKTKNSNEFKTREDNKVLENSKKRDTNKHLYRNYERISKKTTDPNFKEPVRVYSKKYQLKNWAETSSDPGPESRPRKLQSIDDDQVIKGRPVDPRRPGFPRQQGSDQPKHEERPRATDRGKRQQLDKDGQDGDTTARSINSAPSKDREAPVPRLNSYMKADKSDKDATNREKANLDKQQDKTKEKQQLREEEKPPDIDRRVDEKVKEPMKDKVRREEPKEDNQKENDRLQNGPTHTQARSERQQPQRREHKNLKLPADDHGPAFTPTITESPMVTNREDDGENFNYYASINKTQKDKDKSDVPPLQLYSKTPTEKSFSTRIIGSDDMHLSSVSPTKSDKSKTITDDMENEKNKKKREVTIVDPRDLKKTVDEIAEEAFNKEYEYSHNDPRRTKDFEDMDEEEKIEFFKSRYRMRPEQIRELTFHPKTNEPKIIHKTYTGIDVADWELAPDSARLKSGRRPKSRHSNAYKKVIVVPTYQRKDFMLSRLQGKIYHHISKVYGSSPRDNREKQFYEKLAQIQLEEYRRRYEMLERNERKRLESMFRQREQLKQLRKKFEKDAWRRFMTQYVTSKVVESEHSNRKDYGLPNTLDSDFHSNMRKKNLTIDPSTKDRINKKRFEHLFKFSTGPDLKVGGKPMKFEGLDTVYIDTEDESGQHVSHRQDVAELIKEARMLLSQTETGRQEDVKQRSQSDRQPPRPVRDTRNRMERPRHHRSREKRRPESDQSPPRRSKSRSKPPKSPKTIRDVILRRQSHPSNRYRMSEFLKNTSKIKATKRSNQGLDKDSSNKNQELKISEGKLPEKKEQKTVTDTTEETVTTVTVSSSKTEPKVTKSIVTSNSSKQHNSGEDKKHTTVDNKPQHKDKDNSQGKTVEDSKREKQINTEQKPHMFLEETETLIGTSRDYDARSPVEHTLSKNTASRSRSESRLSKAREQSRPASKASIQINHNVHKSSSVPKAYNTASRRGSKASLQIPNEIKVNSESVSPYKQEILKRTSSRASIVSKANSVKREVKDTASIQSKTYQNEPYEVPEKLPPHRTASRISVRTVNSLHQNDLKPYRRASRTSVQLQNGVDKITEGTKKDVEINGEDESLNRQDINRKDLRNSTVSIKQMSNSRHVSPSPSRTSKHEHYSEPKRHVEVKDISPQEPVMKRNVHISEKVEVHTSLTSGEKNVIENGFNDSNGTYTDAKIKREDFENRRKYVDHGQHENQHDRNRSPKGTQHRSKSREGKDSVPSKKTKAKQKGSRSTKDRKVISPRSRKKGKSRFPDIEENDYTVSNARATPKSNAKREVKVDEVETETVRTVSPSEKQGAAKWKNLVQKYLREPSPVVGKREDLSVLQTTVESEDSGSEADIFERARRRYALDVEEDSDEDED